MDRRDSKHISDQTNERAIRQKMDRRDSKHIEDQANERAVLRNELTPIPKFYLCHPKEH